MEEISFGDLSGTSPSLVLQRLVRLSEEACTVVLNLLADQSPEGNLPLSFGEVEENVEELIDASIAQDEESSVLSRGQQSMILMSHCWRTMKEVCQLLSMLLDRLYIAEIGCLDDAGRAAFWVIGTLAQTMLTSIRHVGAYAAVSTLFQKFCKKVVRLEDPKMNASLFDWLKEHLTSLSGKSAKISITRRSAGLPFAILSILLAESSVKVTVKNLQMLSDSVKPGRQPTRTWLSFTMDRLFEIAEIPVTSSEVLENKTDIAQVHAFNVLRTIVKDTQISSQILPWIVDAFVIAVKGFKNPW